MKFKNLALKIQIVYLLLIIGCTKTITETEYVDKIVEVEAETETPPEVINHNGIITSDETWKNTSIHTLTDKVVVGDGAILTIEAGTIIKGIYSDNVEDASALLVARGGKLQAMGTSENPIIMTAQDDLIQKDGTYASGSPNLTPADIGLWGGLIVLGKSRCSFKNDVAELQIEGIPAEDTFGLYGGTDDSDDSGVIRYVSIRHGGTNIGLGNEINGLTLGGVGAGTTISNIEVYANQDDGIEFFGGNVNLTNAVVWSQGDDAYDIDQSYNGTISNIVYIAGDDSDHAFEIDGMEGSALVPAARNRFTILNATLKGPGIDQSGREMVDWRSNAEGSITNSYFFNFGTAADVEIDGDGTKYKSVVGGSGKKVDDKVSNNPKLYDNFKSGKIIFSGNEFNSSNGKGYDSSFAFKWAVAPNATSDDNGTFDAKDSSDSRDPGSGATQSEMSTQLTRLKSENASVSEKSANVGANTSGFGWTLAKTSGILNF